MTTPATSGKAKSLSDEESRAAFERFQVARKNKGTSRREHMFNRLDDGTYVAESVQRHWWTWQSAIVAHESLNSEGAGLAGEPAAWLVTNGRLFVDSHYRTKEAAERSASKLDDGSRVVPLYLGPPAQSQEGS